MTHSMPSASTSATLIFRVKRRDNDAWRQFAQLYTPLVYRWARSRKLQANDAADIVQNVFLAVSRKIGSFEGGPESTFRGWLWTITHHAVAEHFRMQGRRPQATGGESPEAHLEKLPQQFDEVGGPDEATDVRLLAHRALQLIRDDVEPHTWQAFWRSTALEHDTREIAEDLGISPKTVRQAKYRVLCRLRDMLRDD